MATEVRDRSDADRFEILVDGAVVGFAEYRTADGVRTFRHTEVDPAHRGRGLAAELVRGALDATRAAGLAVDPRCPYVRRFVDETAEYRDLVRAD